METQSLRYSISNKLMTLIGILGVFIFLANIWSLVMPTELFSLRSIPFAIEQVWLVNTPVFFAWLLIIYIGFSKSRRMLILALPLYISCGGKGMENFLINARNYMPIDLSTQTFFILEVILALTMIITFFIYLKEKRCQGIFLEDFVYGKTGYKLTRIQKKFLSELQKFKNNPELTTLMKMNYKNYLLFFIYFIFSVIINWLIGYWEVSLVLLGILLGMLSTNIGRITIFLEVWPVSKNIIDFNKIDEILMIDKNYRNQQST